MQKRLIDIHGSLLIAVLGCLLFGIGAWVMPPGVLNSGPRSIEPDFYDEDPGTDPVEDSDRGPCPPYSDGGQGGTPISAIGSAGSANHSMGGGTESGNCPTVRVTEQEPVIHDPCPEYLTSPLPSSCTCGEGSLNGSDPYSDGPSMGGLPPSHGLGVPGRGANWGPDSRSGGSSSLPTLDSPYVNAANGDLTQIRQDLSLQGGAAGFRLGRHYRSRLVDYDSVIGTGWELNTLQRIKVLEPGSTNKPVSFLVQEGNGVHSGVFREDVVNTSWFGNSNRLDQFHYVQGTGSELHKFVHYLPNGNQETYTQLQASSNWYHITRSENIWGNGFNLDYTSGIPMSPTPWTLTKVTDDLGREITFHYEDTQHGRLERVEVHSGVDLIAEVDYTYEIKTNGAVLLTNVKRGQIATEDTGGNLVFVRESESYAYDFENSQSQAYSDWRLSGIVNGAGEQVVSWEYYTGADEGRVKKQTDRSDASKRALGIHQYTYSNSQNTYVGPDGETREFNLDTNGRITRRVEHPDAQTTVSIIFTYDDTHCSVCDKLSTVTYPDGSYDLYHYDTTTGNLVSQWWYPASGSALPPRVERWRWSDFAPVSGKYRVRMLEHELRRDADVTESPENACCVHPSNNQLHGADGHHVHFYNWSADERKLTDIDYGSIQNADGSISSSIARTAFFEYFGDGRLKTAIEKEDGNEVSRREFLLDPLKVYIQSKKVVDSLNGNKSWTTTYSRTPGSYFLSAETSPDGTVTGYTSTISGQLYRIEEDVTGGFAKRSTDFRFDAAGRLVKIKTVASDGVSEQVVLRLDEFGAPYEVETTGTNGGVRLDKLTYTPGGQLSTKEDWRGWKQEAIYGVGSFRLPIEVKEYFGGQTRTLWQAGDGGSDSGYDQVGRLTSYRNVAGWKNYLSYNARGGLKYVFQQMDDIHYSTEAYIYDARGFLKEKNAGSIDSNPLSAEPQDFTWLQHIIYSRNLIGHLLSRSVYEDGDTIIARRTRFTTDGRGRVVRTEVFQGDRSQPTSAVAVASEIDFDALNRPLGVRWLESSSSTTPVRNIEIWYDDALRSVRLEETLGASSAKKKVELFRDSFGRPLSRTETPWVNGAWGASRSWQYEHDGLNRPLAFTDPLGKRTAWLGDDFGNLLSETIAPSSGSGNQVTAYSYDSGTGALLTATDAAGKITSYLTTDWLRPFKVTYPDSRTFEITAYDDLGRRTQTMDDRGVQHNYTYDYTYLTNDNVVKPQGGLVPGPSSLSWEYDRSKGTLTRSRVLDRTTVTWETTFTHNALGEKTAETQGAGTDAMTWSNWDYGFAGELLGATYPSALGINNGVFGYDAAGRINSIQYLKGATVLSTDIPSYDGFRTTGRTDSVSGLDVSFGYDGFGRLDHVDWSKDVGGAPTMLDGQDRGFDLAGHVTSRQRVLDSIADVFIHDGYGRMKDWYRGVPGGQVASFDPQSSTWTNAELYTLNSVYGRDKVVNEVNGGSSVTRDYVSNNSHFYTSVDGQSRTQQSGRLNFDGTHYFRWDAWGRLSEVDNSAGQTIRKHHYDAEGRRVRTEGIEPNVGTEVTRLVYWDARLAATFTEGISKKNIRTYGYAGGADGESFVEMTASESPLVDGSYALARDFQGSVLALIDRTTKSVVERYRYGVFGRVSIEDAQGQPLAESAYGNTRFFLGKPFDAEVGIYDLRNRWYDAATGSFLSPDPLGPVDSWNMYQYGYGAPATWMDPFGLQSGGVGQGLWTSTPARGLGSGVPFRDQPGITIRPAKDLGPNPEGTFNENELTVVIQQAAANMDGGEIAAGVGLFHEWVEIIGPNGERLASGGMARADSDGDGEEDSSGDYDKPTEIVDHSGREPENTVPTTASPSLVLPYLQSGRATGNWLLSNNCNDEVWRIIRTGGDEYTKSPEEAFDKVVGGLLKDGFQYYCFEKDTLVQTLNGEQRIMDVKPGTFVWSFDLSRKEWRPGQVEAVMKRQLLGRLATLDLGGEIIHATGTHPFWVSSGHELVRRPAVVNPQARGETFPELGRWVSAQDLRAGDLVFGRENRMTILESVKIRIGKMVVYNLRVSGLFNFSIGSNGILVHNRSLQ